MMIRPQGLSAATAFTAVVVLLGGCATSKLPEPTTAAPVESRAVAAKTAPVAATPATPAATTPGSQISTVDLNRPGAGTGVAGASASGSRSAPGAAGGAASGTMALAALPSQRVVYFDFDSFVIRDDFQPVLDGYAKVLQAQRGKKLVIEGHTDERGGREYNLALGQKRAAAVVKSLTLLGATEAQLEAVSFGEERPAATGNEESAWAKNRRAELKDR